LFDETKDSFQEANYCKRRIREKKERITEIDSKLKEYEQMYKEKIHEIKGETR